MKNRSFAKMFAQFWITLAASVVLTQASVYADGGGGSDVGGGGDTATEAHIDGIRIDILRWIEEGGAASLVLPSRITQEQYVARMNEVLAQHAVVIGAVTSEQENQTDNPELQVIVSGQPKTCRGFISVADGLRHILCNVERFAATPPDEQYRLVHHEYAGLSGVEQNIGASSDYEVSRQIAAPRQNIEGNNFGFSIGERVMIQDVSPYRVAVVLRVSGAGVVTTTSGQSFRVDVVHKLRESCSGISVGDVVSYRIPSGWSGSSSVLAISDNCYFILVGGEVQIRSTMTPLHPAQSASVETGGRRSNRRNLDVADELAPRCFSGSGEGGGLDGSGGAARRARREAEANAERLCERETGRACRVTQGYNPRANCTPHGATMSCVVRATACAL